MTAPEISGAAGTDSAIFNANPLPTLIVDADSLRIVSANAAALERYGYPIELMLSLRLTDLIDSSVAPRPIAHRELTEHDAVIVEQQRHRRRDGTGFPVHSAIRSFTIGDKHVWIVAVTEMSELRPGDAEERFVDKMEALARLGGGVAHEFNNLMTAILATTDLALATPDLPESLRVDLQDIRIAGQRAATMTRQLLAFSGNQTQTLRDANVNELVEQLGPLIRHITPENVTTNLDLKATGGVRVDPARLEQVILNLVLNAVDAMPSGGMITVRTEDFGPDTSIVVSDTGSGIDELTLARIFEPFNSSKGPGGGRGLGLASVYGTVRQMRGTTEIETNAHHATGTSVRLRFPTIAAPPELEIVPVKEPSGGTAGGEVILVVEDEAVVRAPICRTLRNLGYFVLEADNGEQALRVMQEYHSPVHLIITDVMMPEMSGTELIAMLRSWYPGLRVLFISGYSSEYLEAMGGAGVSDGQGARVNGAHFLAKPFGLDVLSRRVREILDAEWRDVEPKPSAR